MDGGADLLRRVGRDRRQIVAERMRERDVRDDAVAEERADPSLACDRRTDPGTTMSSGLYSIFRLPTALADRMRSTPSTFMP